MSKNIQITSKGFKTLAITKEQCGFIWNTPGICDSCNEIPKNGIYVGVLNSYYCQACYDSWHKVARNYPEDRKIEDRNIENIHFKLQLC